MHQHVTLETRNTAMFLWRMNCYCATHKISLVKFQKIPEMPTFNIIVTAFNDISNVMFPQPYCLQIPLQFAFSLVPFQMNFTNN